MHIPSKQRVSRTAVLTGVIISHPLLCGLQYYGYPRLLFQLALRWLLHRCLLARDKPDKLSG